MTRISILALMLGAPFAWATVGTCTSGATLNTYQPPDLATGCAYINQSFTNIAVNAAPLFNGSLGTPSDYTLTSNPALGDTLTPTTGLGVADFSSPLWASSGNQIETDLGYVVQAHTGGSTGGYTYSNGVNGYVDPALNPWLITSITLDLTSSHTATTGTGTFNSFIQVREDICINDTTLSQTGACTEDTGANSASILLILQGDGAGNFVQLVSRCWGLNNAGDNCAANGFSVAPGGKKITLTFPTGGVQVLSVKEDVVLQSSAGNTATLLDLDNTFGTQSVAPEPGTWLLVAAALALLALRTKVRPAPASHNLLDRS